MLLENVVIPFLEKHDLKYVKGDGVVALRFGGRENLDMHIQETTKQPALHIIVPHLVAFPEGDGYLPTLAHELNARTCGKWLLQDDGDLWYVLDVLAHEDLTQEAFKQHFDYALQSCFTLREPLMVVRYVGVTLEQALEGPGKRQPDPDKKDVRRLIEEALADNG